MGAGVLQRRGRLVHSSVFRVASKGFGENVWIVEAWPRSKRSVREGSKAVVAGEFPAQSDKLYKGEAWRQQLDEQSRRWSQDALANGQKCLAWKMARRDVAGELPASASCLLVRHQHVKGLVDARFRGGSNGERSRVDALQHALRLLSSEWLAGAARGVIERARAIALQCRYV